MSDDHSESQPSTIAEALAVGRNAKIGLLVGVGVAVMAYVIRVFELLGPAKTGREYPVVGPEGWFLILAIVLAVATALLVAVVLTGIRAVGLARNA